MFRNSAFYIEYKGCNEPPCPRSPGLEDSGGSWLGFRFLIMMGMGLQCPKLPMFRNSAFYIEYKGAKNPHVLEVLDWGFGGLWRFLTEVSGHDHDGDVSSKSQITYVPKFSFLHWMKRCKEPYVLKVVDWRFGWLWKFLTGVLVFDHDGDGCTMSQIVYVPTFSFLQ